MTGVQDQLSAQALRVRHPPHDPSHVGLTAEHGLHGLDLEVDRIEHFGPETGFWAREHAGTGLVAEAEVLKDCHHVLHRLLIYQR